MHHISLEDASLRLPQLISEVNDGEDVVLTQASQPVARLVPISPVPQRRARRQAGTAKGMGYMTADFDAPLEDFKEYME
jgi:prevent-host-death family protein